METIVRPNMDVVRKGVLIAYATNLGSGLGGISARRNLSCSLTLPTTTNGVVGTPQMVFTNLIMTIHVNRTTNRPLMTSMVVGGYKNVDATNPRGGYQKPYVVTTQIPNHKDGHYVRPNMLFFSILTSKYVDAYVHVKVFNYVVKENVMTFEGYIINVLSYTLGDTN